MLVLSVCLSSSFNEVFNPKSFVERHAFIPQSFVVSETTKTTPPSEEINEEDRDKESDKAIENETMQQLKRQVLVTLENEEKVIVALESFSKDNYFIKKYYYKKRLFKIKLIPFNLERYRKIDVCFFIEGNDSAWCFQSLFLRKEIS